MSAICIQSPIYVIACDGRDCREEYQPAGRFAQRSPNYARSEARQFGWTVRPPFGKDSRKGPDLCPACSPTT